MRSTVARSLENSNGFSMISQDVSRAKSAASPDTRSPVENTSRLSTSGYSFSIRSCSSIPERPGIRRSATTSEYGGITRCERSSMIISRARSPSPASSTSKPMRVKKRRSANRIVDSSSTTRTRGGVADGTSPVGRGSGVASIERGRPSVVDETSLEPVLTGQNANDVRTQKGLGYIAEPSLAALGINSGRGPEPGERRAVRRLTQLLERAFANLSNTLARHAHERADLLEGHGFRTF